MTSVLDRTVGFLANRLDRRGFLGKSAVIGSAVVAAPLDFALRPGTAYAAVCNCNGSSCQCGSLCCDGYTEFCCTLNGANACPPGTITAGWWKVDGSQFCGGAARYYLDCNAQCGSCSCGANGVCAGSCSGTGCGCANGSCGNRKAGCTRFRYGQCNQGVRCVGPIVCRVVTCAPPWQFDPACGTSSRTDNATRNHDRPCLNDPFGTVERAVDVGGAVWISGWAVANSDYQRAGIRVMIDDKIVYHGVADMSRPDVKQVYSEFDAATGYDVRLPALPGRRVVCVWGVDRRTGRDALLGMREVEIQAPRGRVESTQMLGGGRVRLVGWALANSANERGGIRVYSDQAVVYEGNTDRARPDIQGPRPGAPSLIGFDVTVNAGTRPRLLCVWAIDRRTGGLGLIAATEVNVT